MEYLLWVLIALLAYSGVAPLTSVIMEDVPATPGLFLATLVFLVIASGVMVSTGTADPSAAVSVEAGYVYVAGAFLTIGILAYTAALESGPVSVVVPVFGLFIVGSSVLSILFLGETMTATRAAGIVCAVLAIVCSAGGNR
ncbi:EamA family transporter [Natronorubrum halophilum]|uniref:EamA family transporter n=1 Tax=Natronorubrum halophilum TaxID=1702106 RepID=UPI000EF71D9D|nr:EamA family transporter [Natronorubrum halophilum]